MVDFLIQRMISPFVAPTNRCFEKATAFIVKKHRVQAADLNHDLKTLIYNATMVMIVSAVVMAYFKTIYLITAAATIALFYLLRRVIEETMKPPKQEKAQERRSFLINLWSSTAQAVPAVLQPAVSSWTSYFYLDGTFTLGRIVIWKSTKYPLAELLRLIMTRGN